MAKGARKNDLDGLLARMAKSKVVVVGDVILDKFLYGTVERISPEAPVPVVDVQGQPERRLGGAANVVRNLRSLGADAVLVGAVGKDRAAKTLRELLEKEGASFAGLVEEPGRKTAIKTRVIAQKHQIVRYDQESKGPLSKETAVKLGDAVVRAMKDADAVIVSDYGKGVVSADMMAQLAAHTTEAGIPLAVDPKPQNRSLYQGVGIVTPNVKETEAMCPLSVSSDAEAEAAGFALLRQLDTRAILVTRGEKGMTLVERGKRKAVHIRTRAKDVFDVTGAGDTAISVFTLAWAAGADLAMAAELANCAAGVVVGKLGTAVVSPEELREAAADIFS